MIISNKSDNFSLVANNHFKGDFIDEQLIVCQGLHALVNRNLLIVYCL